MSAYLMLITAVLAEVFADSMMKLSEGFKRKIPIIGVVGGYVVAFYCMSHTLEVFPLGPVYAAWTGLGIALTAVVGMVFWREGLNVKKAVGLIAVIAGVVVLKLGV
ncbi:MAG: SMR family transporter [Raoultibacter sp.]